jgi:hypothetical protein
MAPKLALVAHFPQNLMGYKLLFRQKKLGVWSSGPPFYRSGTQTIGLEMQAI